MVKFPFWRLTRKKVKRQEIPRESFEKFMESYRIVREAYCEYHGINWKSLEMDQRLKHAKNLKNILINFPNLLINRNDEAIFIQSKIIKRAPDRHVLNVTQEALIFLDYLIRYKGDLRTVEYVIGESVKGEGKRQQGASQKKPEEADEARGEGYLSARAYLKIGRKLVEVEAVIQEPQFLPEILVNRKIPFDDLPVPPLKYHLVARYEHPTYGTLISRVDVEIRSGERKQVNFVFTLPEKRAEGGTKLVIQPPPPPPTQEERKKYGVGIVEGQVVDRNNKPIMGARVWISDLPLTSEIGFESYTDEDGRYSIDDVPASFTGDKATKHRIDVEHYYYDSKGKVRRIHDYTNFPIKPGEIVTVNFILNIPTEYHHRPVPHGEIIDGKIAGFGTDRDLKRIVKARHILEQPARFAERFKIAAGGIAFPLLLFIIGIGLSATFGIWQFIVAFTCWAIRSIIPDPHDWEPAAGTIWSDKENIRFAAFKALLKALSLLFFGWALWLFAATSFPLASLIFIVFAFISYFSLKGMYDPRKPYEFLEGFIRFLIGTIVIPFMIFNGIFHSMALAWLSLAFFAVLPTPVVEQKGILVKALGKGYAKFSEDYEAYDKIIFLILMMIGLFATTGSILIPGLRIPTVGLGLTGGAIYTFYAVWGIGLVAGFLSPAATRPYTGLLVVGTSFLLFAFGPGGDAVGTAFFGQWWPTIHNTASQILKPLGQILSGFSNTFAQTFMMLTNPIGFAHQVMEGNYVKGEVGETGAFGLEIESLQADIIYVDQPFTITTKLANRGPVDARRPTFRITSNIEKIYINGTPLRDFGEKDKYGKILYSYDYEVSKDKIYPQDIVPIFLLGNISCEDALSDAFKRFEWDPKKTKIRDIPIQIEAKITYEYDVYSNLQVTFISNDEWMQRARNNQLQLRRLPSSISTSPAKLSLDAMDQPIKEGNPFYVAFNLTPEEPNSEIGDAMVYVILPKELGVPSICTYPIGKSAESGKTLYYQTDNETILFWFLTKNDRKDVFCYFEKAPKINAPEKTYTIMANATYTFIRRDSTETRISFSDTCIDKWDEVKGRLEKHVPVTITEASKGTVVLSVMLSLYVPKYEITEQQIDAYLKANAEGSLKYQARNFYQYGEEYDIDPAFAVAVAMHESGRGGSELAKKYNNYFGIKEGGDYKKFDTPDAGIKGFYELINNSYVNKYRQTTIEEIACAPNTNFKCCEHCYCERDGSYCPEWVEDVTLLRAQIQLYGKQQGDKGFCGYLYSSYGKKCILGMGGCKSNDDCCQKSEECLYIDASLFLDKYGKPLQCRNIRNGICCFEGMSDESCINAYNEWKNQIAAGLDPYKAYPDKEKIKKAAGI